MSLAEETKMSDAKIDDFLSRQESGVLSLARDCEPYAVPISYGYDPSERTLYMRLVSSPESDKRSYLESGPTARFVVYNESDDGQIYWSVVAEGTLEEIEPDSLSVDQIEQYSESKRPLFEIWGAEKDDLTIQLFRFAPSELSGRKTVVER
jgi:nitroimidazol reductase NimA-like FMN-containing flavoprotein (pyridoxamine 5'-phosphate oxidase superfamily)